MVRMTPVETMRAHYRSFVVCGDIRSLALPDDLNGEDAGGLPNQSYEAISPIERVRRESFWCRRIARVLIGEATGVAPRWVTLTQRCAECGGPHGQPRALGSNVSWSHSHGRVAVAVSPRPIGVDVELLSRFRPTNETLQWLQPSLTGRETRMLLRAGGSPMTMARTWTRKEAAVKIALCTLDSLNCIDVTESHPLRFERTFPEVKRELPWRFETREFDEVVCSIVHDPDQLALFIELNEQSINLGRFVA